MKILARTLRSVASKMEAVSTAMFGLAAMMETETKQRLATPPVKIQLDGEGNGTVTNP